MNAKADPFGSALIDSSKDRGIATPACGLVRDDRNYFYLTKLVDMVVV